MEYPNEYAVSGEDSSSREFDSDADCQPSELSEGSPEVASLSQGQYTEWKFYGIYRLSLQSDWAIGESVPADELQAWFEREHMRLIPKGIIHFVVEIDLSGRRYDGPFQRDFSVPMRGLIQGRAALADTWQKWLGYQALTFEALSSIEFFDEYQNFVQNFKRPDSDHPGWVVVAGGGRRKIPQFLGKSWKFTG